MNTPKGHVLNSLLIFIAFCLTIATFAFGGLRMGGFFGTNQDVITFALAALTLTVYISAWVTLKSGERR